MLTFRQGVMSERILNQNPSHVAQVLCYSQLFITIIIRLTLRTQGGLHAKGHLPSSEALATS